MKISLQRIQSHVTARVFCGIPYSLECNPLLENVLPFHTLLSSLEQTHQVTFSQIYYGTSNSKCTQRVYHLKCRLSLQILQTFCDKQSGSKRVSGVGCKMYLTDRLSLAVKVHKIKPPPPIIIVSVLMIV